MYLALEGIDGVGKSTQMELLRNAYPEGVFTKEPGGTPLGARIREMVLGANDYAPKTELLLFLADRAEHVAKVIAPNRDRLIVSDRSLVSGIAYADPAFATEELVTLNRFAAGEHLPEKIVHLVIDEASLKARLGSRPHDNIEARGYGFLLGIQERIARACKALEIDTLSLDATLPPEAIHHRIVNFLHG